MTDRRAASQAATHPNHVWVYGNDHSPWVQSILLGLHEKGTAHTLVTVPPREAPAFMLTPFGYHEIDPIVSLLDRVGFRSIDVEKVPTVLERPSARSLAIGLVEGNPGIVEIRERARAEPDEIVEAVAEAIRDELGDDPVRCPMQAIVVSARGS